MTEEQNAHNTPNSSLSGNLKPVVKLSRCGKSDNSPDYTIYKVRLNEIVKNLQQNQEKWDRAQKRGLDICKAIESIKSVEISKSSMGDQSLNEDCQLYPPELKVNCDKLYLLVNMFVGIVDSTEECLRKLRSLCELTRISHNTFYRSWELEHFVKFVEQLLKVYRMDIKKKETVKKELPHCMTKSDLVNFTSEWEYPEAEDNNLGYLFAILKEETKITTPELDL